MKPNKPFTISAAELEHMRDQTFVWHVDLEPGSLQDEDMTLLAIEGTLTLRRQLNMIQCEGDLQAKVRMISGRSLEPFEAEFAVKFVEGMEVAEYFHFPENLEIGREDAVDQVKPDDPIDLIELVRQHIILNLPIQAPESGDAPEICYNDGLSPHESGPEEMDPAWEAIRKTVETWETPSDN
ncbi:MAG: hypothetical protein CVV27_01695 [Candidatus Melainabacteria bacterium HGW-Melainabacteria-1]|nr:MAG: hypothetical protein CVV27_01695 [Candidatus Melainabacteria bacterium HGW-Melainabacteria-1]